MQEAKKKEYIQQQQDLQDIRDLFMHFMNEIHKLIDRTKTNNVIETVLGDPHLDMSRILSHYHRITTMPDVVFEGTYSNVFARLERKMAKFIQNFVNLMELKLELFDDEWVAKRILVTMDTINRSKIPYVMGPGFSNRLVLVKLTSYE